MTRDEIARAFLSEAGWGSARRKPLAGDASNRRYERLSLDGAPAVLMDAPPEKGEDVRPFMHIASYLQSLGLSAPRILASDPVNGFLLLEDLGDALFARVIPDQPGLETSLYTAATDVLLALHAAEPPAGLKVYDAPLMAELATLSYHWYAAAGRETHGAEAAAFQSAFRDVLSAQITDFSVLIQRDYHAENLLWLPERAGAARVGLLDFQDAMLGHPAYDLVSLMQDARRDVPADLEDAMISHYCQCRGIQREAFEAAYALLGAQRNLRILGVFARLSLHFGKPHYIDFIPRVWYYLERDLAHPALSGVRSQLLSDLPEPTRDHLNRLKDACGTIPTP